jgi:putative transposase
VRYRSSPVEPGQWLLACMCYIERLPVIHKLASSAYHYHRSSYRMRLGKTGHYWLDDPEEYARLGGTIQERAEAYRVYMSNGLDRNEEKMIDTAVKRCKLTGSIQFIKEVYRRYGVLGINRGPGRPRKRRKSPPG